MVFFCFNQFLKNLERKTFAWRNPRSFWLEGCGEFEELFLQCIWTKPVVSKKRRKIIDSQVRKGGHASYAVDRGIFEGTFILGATWGYDWSYMYQMC